MLHPLSVYSQADLPVAASIDDALEEELKYLKAETYVITASRIPENIKKSASSITVITDKEIRQMGARHLADVIQTVPGMNYFHSSFGTYQFGIRGDMRNFQNVILVMVNGHPINEGWRGAATFTHDTMVLDNVKQIEVIRGPGSALYGANAYAGVINIITKEAADIEGLELKAGGGSYHPTIQPSLCGSIYAEKLQAIFSETFKKLGGTVTSQEAVAPTDTDMRPVLTKIATGKPEFIYYPVFIAAGGHITRQVKEVKGLEKVALMGADGIFSPDFYKAPGETAVGMYHSSPDFSAFGEGYKTFLEKHQKKYGEKPIAPFHAHAYDAAMMIFAAIEKVAQKAPDGTLYIGRKALKDALYATKNFKSLTGNLTCDPNGDCADPRIAIYKTSAENIKNLVLPDKPFWKPYAVAAPGVKTPPEKSPVKK